MLRQFVTRKLFSTHFTERQRKRSFGQYRPKLIASPTRKRRQDPVLAISDRVPLWTNIVLTRWQRVVARSGRVVEPCSTEMPAETPSLRAYVMFTLDASELRINSNPDAGACFYMHGLTSSRLHGVIGKYRVGFVNCGVIINVDPSCLPFGPFDSGLPCTSYLKPLVSTRHLNVIISHRTPPFTI